MFKFKHILPAIVLCGYVVVIQQMGLEILDTKMIFSLLLAITISLYLATTNLALSIVSAAIVANGIHALQKQEIGIELGIMYFSSIAIMSLIMIIYAFSENKEMKKDIIYTTIGMIGVSIGLAVNYCDYLKQYFL